MLKYKKQTKLWTCKDGSWIRICDMTDSHLRNTIAFLERHTKMVEEMLVIAPNPFNGDIASDLFDQRQDDVLENGLDPSEVCAYYDNFIIEQERRKHGPCKIK